MFPLPSINVTIFQMFQLQRNIYSIILTGRFEYIFNVSMFACGEEIKGQKEQMSDDERLDEFNGSRCVVSIQNSLFLVTNPKVVHAIRLNVSTQTL